MKKKLQQSEKRHKNVNLGDKNWQTSERKSQTCGKKFTKSDRLVKRKSQTCEKISQKVTNY